MLLMPAWLVACRPRQWPKNLLVFAAPLFAFRFEADVWLRAGGALVAFCLISSAIYLLNDCLDVAADWAALTTAAVLAAVALPIAVLRRLITLWSLVALTVGFVALSLPKGD